MKPYASPDARLQEVSAMPLIHTLAALMILGLLASCTASLSSGTPTPRSDQSKYGP
jgi:hypothetical protein